MTKVTQLNLDEKDGSGRRRIHLREISGDGEGLDTVGGVLRAARQRLGDDLATVSGVLKIRKDHLEAVEEGNLEALPGKTYAIGFVRSYASYLGLDAPTLVERFKQEAAGYQQEEIPAFPIVHMEDGRRLPQGWRIIAVIVVAILGYGIWHLLSSGPAAQTVPPPPPLTPARHQAAVRPPSVVPQAYDSHSAPPPDAALAADTAAVPPPALGTQAASTASEPVSPPSGTAYGTRNHNARVVLRITNDTHVLVRGRDGMVYINRDLKPGDSYALPNIVGLTLSATHAGAVEIYLDGQVMGQAGTGPQPANDLPMNPQDIADRSGGH